MVFVVSIIVVVVVSLSNCLHRPRPFRSFVGSMSPLETDSPPACSTDTPAFHFGFLFFSFGFWILESGFSAHLLLCSHGIVSSVKAIEDRQRRTHNLVPDTITSTIITTWRDPNATNSPTASLTIIKIQSPMMLAHGRRRPPLQDLRHICRRMVFY